MKCFTKALQPKNQLSVLIVLRAVIEVLDAKCRGRAI